MSYAFTYKEYPAPIDNESTIILSGNLDNYIFEKHCIDEVWITRIYKHMEFKDSKWNPPVYLASIESHIEPSLDMYFYFEQLLLNKDFINE